ncbi:hypothetical protein EVAR_11430_1 [Eumeta japonica]|uniref:Uncharacterized protein n=1 Tax=Eumeta variegata TaxID=151549 RepID=A0A4C1TN20_EUMVA|nr:hypothetical protein EVAR_11430_1 [Eumeta japonica]
MLPKQPRALQFREHESYSHYNQGLMRRSEGGQTERFNPKPTTLVSHPDVYGRSAGRPARGVGSTVFYNEGRATPRARGPAPGADVLLLYALLVAVLLVFPFEELPATVKRGRTVGKKMVASFFRVTGHYPTIVLEDKKKQSSQTDVLTIIRLSF